MVVFVNQIKIDQYNLIEQSVNTLSLGKCWHSLMAYRDVSILPAKLLK